MKCPATVSLRFALTGAITCVTATAPAADQFVDRLRACATEAQDAVRLHCYDMAIGRSEGGRDEDMGVTAELLRSKRREAGLAEPAPHEMSATVVSVIVGPSGKFVVTLDNGQIWSQQETLSFQLQVGDVVTVRHGVLGALWMSSGQRHLETRVQRTH